MSELLRLEDASLAFGGLVALDGLSLSLPAGVVGGVIGPNGAGKSTVFNLITGLYRPSRGGVFLEGERISGRRVDRVARLGVARTFQNIRLFAFMSARENVLVGRHGRMRAGLLDAALRTPRHRAEERDARAAADALLDLVGLRALADVEARALSYGDRRRLEIARALAAEPKLLLLDEPAAGMNPSERASLLALIGRIRARGVGVLVVEHDMALIAGACEIVWVLDRGVLIASGAPEAVRRDPRVVEAYLGAPEAAA